MRAANLSLAVLFAFSAAVQWNDPDPIRWSAIYGAAFVTCVLWERRRRVPRALPAAVGAVALAWAAVSARETHLTAPIGEALTDWGMHAGGSEELRETLGLLLVAGWMLPLALRPARG